MASDSFDGSDWDASDDDSDEPIDWTYQRVIPLGNGRFALNLAPEEREILRKLPHDLKLQIQDGDDTSTMRLFPPAYSDDLGRQVEFERLMRGELQASHIEALEMLERTAHETELDEPQLLGWIRALNELRLVAGTNLGIDNDEYEYEPKDDDDPLAGVWSLYVYLGYLQHQGVDALSQSL